MKIQCVFDAQERLWSWVKTTGQRQHCSCKSRNKRSENPKPLKVTSEIQYPEMIRSSAQYETECLKARPGNTPNTYCGKESWVAGAWQDVPRRLDIHSSLRQGAASVRNGHEALGCGCLCTWCTRSLREKLQCVSLQSQPSCCCPLAARSSRSNCPLQETTLSVNTFGHTIQQGEIQWASEKT